MMTRIKDVFHTSPRRAALSPSGSKIFAKDGHQSGICAHFSGTYSFLRLLGQGAMASVYEADYRGMLVAVKVYHTHFNVEAPDEERDKLLKKIIYIGSLPENQRIVPLFAYRFEPCLHGGSQLTLVMGLMSTSLSTIVKQRRKAFYGNKHKTVPFPDRLDVAPFSQLEIAHILLQIVEGVEFLHRHDVIHRDLKAENILARRHDFESLSEVFEKGSIVRNTSRETLSQSSSKSARLGGKAKNSNDDDDDNEKDQSATDADDEQSSSGDANRLPPPKKYLETSIDICTGKETENLEQNVGRCYEYKIADFDECRVDANANVLRRSSSLSQSTKKQKANADRHTLHVGTVNYSSPEMVDTTTVTYSSKVDIWSIGMILYLLLTLEIPYSERKDQFHILAALQQKQMPTLPLGYIHSSEWNGVLHIYNCCVQIDPEKRFSASDLLQVITKIM